ncbi:MAG: hypothetical protein IPQ05_17295 [Leptospiraceae bacterium]|nr:hypothetical protein [Leptospiraceae bacterium]
MLRTFKIVPFTILRTLLYLALISFLPYLNNSLSAKVTCTGPACDAIPQKYISQFDNIDATFQSQYLQPVMQSMIQASVISNNGSGMIGAGYVNRFQVGVGLGAGYVRKEDITVSYGDVGIPKLPNVGVSAAPTVMGAVNLGWLLGKGGSLHPTKDLNENKSNVEDDDDDDDEEDDNRKYFHRFNFYFHGMKANYQTTDVKAAYNNKPEVSGGIKLESFGIMLRYQIIEPKISSFSFFGFSGISAGVGYNMQNFVMDLNHQPRTNPTISFGQLQGAWVARTEFDFASSVRSIPMELRTGIKLFYFFDFFVGVGYSKNYGMADLHLSRGGPVKLSVDPYYVFNSSILTSDYYKYYTNNSLNPSKGPLNPEGTLSMDFRQKTKIHNNTNYIIVGTEFNFAFLKILAEATILEKAYGANVGLKVAF